MTYSKTKYIAALQLTTGEFSYTASGEFDDCFAFIQKFIKSPYKRAYIENIETGQIILSMREAI